MSEALGALFGELGVLLNAGGYDNIVHHFFTAGPDFSIGFSGDTPQPVVIDLFFVKFALGFGFKGNALGGHDYPAAFASPREPRLFALGQFRHQKASARRPQSPLV